MFLTGQGHRQTQRHPYAQACVAVRGLLHPILGLGTDGQGHHDRLARRRAASVAALARLAVACNRALLVVQNATLQQPFDRSVSRRDLFKLVPHGLD